jgi:hypothetical protein
MSTYSVTYNGYKVKVFISGRLVKTYILKGRDPVAVREQVKAILISRGVTL